MIIVFSMCLRSGDVQLLMDDLDLPPDRANLFEILGLFVSQKSGGALWVHQRIDQQELNGILWFYGLDYAKTLALTTKKPQPQQINVVGIASRNTLGFNHHLRSLFSWQADLRRPDYVIVWRTNETVIIFSGWFSTVLGYGDPTGDNLIDVNSESGFNSLVGLFPINKPR